VETGEGVCDGEIVGEGVGLDNGEGEYVGEIVGTGDGEGEDWFQQ